jgi:ketosteroid isomerase-like protein
LIAQTCRPGVKATMRDMQVYPLGDDAAATVGHWELTSTGPDGKPATAKVRTTEVLVKKDGKWRYLIDHASVGAPAQADAAARAGAAAPAASAPAKEAGKAAGESSKDEKGAAKPE